MAKINSKMKGKNGELEVVKLFKEYGFEDAHRSQQFSGANADADVEGIPFLHVEVKRNERLNIYDAIEQAIRDNRDGLIPAVIHRKNNKPWLVTMLADDWFELYKAYVKEKGLDYEDNKN